MPQSSRSSVLGHSLAMLADDITGACDAGVQFALRGAKTRVYLKIPEEASVDADLTVLVTYCRDQSELDAGREVGRACKWIAASGASLCYKKIDSTLKGNVGAELEALRRGFPERLILVSPAFPQMQRTLRDGWLHARPSESIAPIHLPTLLSEQQFDCTHLAQPECGDPSKELLRRIEEVRADGASVVTIDAVLPSDLSAIVEAAFQIDPMPLLVGSAGLAAAWSERLLSEAKQSSTARGFRSAKLASTDRGAVVLCVGSTNPVTCRQLEYFMATERAVKIDIEGNDLTRVEGAVKRGQHIIIPPPRDSKDSEYTGSLLTLFAMPEVRGCLCTGGDTARTVCDALAIRAIDLRHEIIPGLPWGTMLGGAADGMPICTKAGGFGDTEALCQAVNFLSAQVRGGTLDR